jgi:SAM-dependent methyltransferase
MMIDFWNERYKQQKFAYGIEANEFLKEVLGNYKLGKILFPAEGEGRNAVFAAKLGWDVNAFDLSIEGKKKADYLASINKVDINYEIGNLDELNYQKESFDAIALIYAHFHPQIKNLYYQTIETYLKKGGVIIFEAFGKNHMTYQNMNPNVGGPNNTEMLFSVNEVQSYFTNYQILELVEKEINLSEGLYHNGLGSVIRFIGIKK